MAFVSLMTVGLLSVVLGVTAPLSHAQPAPVVDYDTYPPDLPDTCTVEGADVIVGAQYSVNGTTAGDLDELTLAPGNTVTMTWTGFAPGCEAVGIGLSVKIALEPTFDVNDDQYLNNFDYCGPDGPLCEAPYQLQVEMPPAMIAPCWQVDAHLGPPLSVVGPSGSYYGLNGVRNMLISANNGGTTPCTPAPCEENPAVPAGAIECTPGTTSTTAPDTSTTVPGTSTTVPDTSTTTTDTTSTSAPAVTSTTSGQANTSTSTTAAPTTTSTAAGQCAAGQVRDTSTGQCVDESSVSVLGNRQAVTTTTGSTRTAAAALPRTGGSGNANLLLASFGLSMMGAAFLLFARRPVTTD